MNPADIEGLDEPESLERLLDFYTPSTYTSWIEFTYCQYMADTIEARLFELSHM